MPAHEVDYKILGDDMQFVEVELDPGESAVAEAGAMMYMTSAIAMETIFGDGSGQGSGGIMGAARGVSIGIAFQRRLGVGLFGGEGLFFATLTGPGRVWLQSLPLSRLAGRIYKAIPSVGGSRKEEGSILGAVGDLLDGDS